MAKKKAQEPAVRKSFLVMGGVAIGAALFGFILLNFVLGGGDGGEEATELATLNGASIPIASATPAPGSDGAVRNVLTPGGRDPFLSQAPPSGTSSDATSAAMASSGSTALNAPMAAPPPTTTVVPPPAPAPMPVEEGPALSPAAEPEPQATPRPVYGRQTITVLRIYSRSADIRIDDTVYEGARARDVLTERFNLDGFTRKCFYMKDMYPSDSQDPERFKLCADDTVTR